MNLPEYIKLILQRFEKNNIPAYAVGGCVRDMIMGKEPNDYDITTQALPQQIKELFFDVPVIETGIKHGTVTLLWENKPVEITTYRIDGKYLNNRRPENVEFTLDLKDDLCRRDFTINAMAYSLDGKLIDLFGGKQDIENKIIKCVGEPDKRFEEDALRILRALRFASTLGFETDKKTADSILKNYPLLKNISAERIFSEFKKILCGKNVKNILLQFSDVFAEIIPQVKESIGFLQNNPHHIYDVYTHSAYVVENSPPDEISRLSAFFHDIGKPFCYTEDQIGTGHFHGHAKISKELCNKALNALKADNKTKALVCQIVENHDYQIIPEEKYVRRFLAKNNYEQSMRILALKRAESFSKAVLDDDRSKYVDTIEALIEKIVAQEDCLNLKALKINGHDLIENNIKGKKIGQTLNLLLKLVIDKEIENEKEALLNKAKQLNS
ncbi:MAG: HD domain-containing protein [Ruminococcaceae bacterium]|nr:HD domain-containing protein [Oscillospiraceae bacterium]